METDATPTLRTAAEAQAATKQVVLGEHTNEEAARAATFAGPPPPPFGGLVPPPPLGGLLTRETATTKPTLGGSELRMPGDAIAAKTRSLMVDHARTDLAAAKREALAKLQVAAHRRMPPHATPQHRIPQQLTPSH
jgi:hypothetical protein